jgi:hypothetical protein
LAQLWASLKIESDKRRIGNVVHTQSADVGRSEHPLARISKMDMEGE